MIITIQASLTDEQALLLAKEKGYGEIISTKVEKEIQVENDGVMVTTTQLINEEQHNPESSFEFLKRVYEAMIISDATKYFLEVENRVIREQQLVVEQTIRDNVIASVTSSVA